MKYNDYDALELLQEHFWNDHLDILWDMAGYKSDTCDYDSPEYSAIGNAAFEIANREKAIYKLELEIISLKGYEPNREYYTIDQANADGSMVFRKGADE